MEADEWFGIRASDESCGRATKAAAATAGVRLQNGQPRSGLPSLFPLERWLGIVAGVATPALADLVGRLSVDFTQRQVLAALREQADVVWGTETLRGVTQALAEAIAPFQHAARVELVLRWLRQAAEGIGPVRITLAVGLMA